jgi:hypothetical protein
MPIKKASCSVRAGGFFFTLPKAFTKGKCAEFELSGLYGHSSTMGELKEYKSRSWVVTRPINRSASTTGMAWN